MTRRRKAWLAFQWFGLALGVHGITMTDGDPWIFWMVGVSALSELLRIKLESMHALDDAEDGLPEARVRRG